MKNNKSKQLKRICYVVMGFPFVSETFIVEEAQSLKNFGVDMMLISLSKGNFDVVNPGAQAMLDKNQVRFVTDTSKFDLLKSLLKLALLKPLTAFKTLRKALLHSQRWLYFQMLPYAAELIQNKTDYIHVHFANSNLQFAECLSKWTEIPFGFTAHGGYDIRDTTIPIPEFSRLANQTCSVVTVSKYNQNLIAEKYHLKPEQIYVAYNGIRAEMFQPSPKQEKHSTLRLLNVGRLVLIKGQDILLEALHHVRNQGFDVLLRIIGDGDLRADLEAQAKHLNVFDCIEFMGAQSQDVVRQCLDEADIFVMPSRSEGFAVACLEAMAMELPVIASNVTGFPEAITDYVTGILVESENSNQLSDAIIWMIQHPDERLEMGKKGREKVLAEFTREKVTQGLLNYWQDSIQK